MRGKGGGLTAEFTLFGFFFVDAFGEDGGVFVLLVERWRWRLVGFFYCLGLFVEGERVCGSGEAGGEYGKG